MTLLPQPNHPRTARAQPAVIASTNPLFLNDAFDKAMELHNSILWNKRGSDASMSNRNSLSYWPEPATREGKTGHLSGGKEGVQERVMHEERDIGDYKIQVTEYAGGYQAAIYPNKNDALPIDWKNKPIWANNVESAFLLAEQRINAELAAL